MMEMHNIIKARRRELGLTLDDVARLVGVSKATVQRWEKGIIKNLKRDKIARLASALLVAPEYLLGWVDDPIRKVDSDLEIACAGLSDEEKKQVLNYVAFLKSQRGRQ